MILLNVESKKAAGDANADNYEYVTYEGYGPNGIAIIVDALTDNKNRTAANVKCIYKEVAEVLELRAVYPLCLIKKDKSSLIKKSARWMRMI